MTDLSTGPDEPQSEPHMLSPRSFIVCGERDDEDVPVICATCAAIDTALDAVTE